MLAILFNGQAGPWGYERFRMARLRGCEVRGCEVARLRGSRLQGCEVARFKIFHIPSDDIFLDSSVCSNCEVARLRGCEVDLF